MSEQQIKPFDSIYFHRIKLQETLHGLNIFLMYSVFKTMVFKVVILNVHI